MDKWTIMDAFKSLDEKLEEKKTLKESVSVHESLDLDEAEAEWLHQRGVVASGDEVDSVGEITGIEDLGDNFDSTVFDFTLDTGTVLTLSGKDIKLNLQEKMPKDLAKAYANFQRRRLYDGSIVGLYDPNSPHAPNDFIGNTRETHGYEKLPRSDAAARDWENSTYTEISKKEALKLPISEKHKLRVIVNSDSDYPKLFMWDINGKCITEPDYSEKSGKFKDIINRADKIYLADEPFIQKRLDRDNRTLTDVEKRDRNVATSIIYDRGSPDELTRKAGRTLYGVGDKQYYREYPDTGMHVSDRVVKSDYSTYQKTVRSYKELVSKAQLAIALTPEQLNTLNENLKQAEKDVTFWFNQWQGEKARREKMRAAAFKPLLMNLELARLICYKQVIRNIQKEGTAIANGEIPHEYNKLADRREHILGEIAKLQKELSDIDLHLKDAKAEFDDDVISKLEKLNDECDEYMSVIDEIRSQHGLVKESLTPGCVYRIYTEKDGVENFIDDAPANKEEAIKYAESLYDEYDNVTLCSLCGDDVEIVCSSANLNEDLSKPSIGEIVDAIINKEKIKKESLTEGKKFNLRDDTDLENAKIYKKIGEETDDNLVVIDPSIESEDEENAPKLGKAILQCKACKTSKFEDTDKLVKSEEDGDVYNIEDACPHCGATLGYYYIGQVGKKEGEETANAGSDTFGDVEAVNSENPETEDVDNSEDITLEPAEDDYSDLDNVDNIKEESFQKLVNSYAKELYENVKEYRVTGVSQPARKRYIVEGVLVGNNEKEIATNFELKVVKNARDSILFEGMNKLLTPAENAFKFTGKLENNTLIFESMDYKYEKDNLLIEGVEKN
jgi:hypothetical protein